MQTKGRDNNHQEILTGWKEIARYLGMGVRTVQRYERDLGLPTRRIRGQRGGSVLATKSDLDFWVNSRPMLRSFDAQQTRSHPHLEIMTLRKDLQENVREIRENILKLCHELQEIRERQDAIAEAVVQYSKIIHGPTGVAKQRRPN